MCVCVCVTDCRYQVLSMAYCGSTDVGGRESAGKKPVVGIMLRVYTVCLCMYSGAHTKESVRHVVVLSSYLLLMCSWYTTCEVSYCHAHQLYY